MTPMRVLKTSGFCYAKKFYPKGSIVEVQDGHVFAFEAMRSAERVQQAAKRDLSSLTVAALKELAHLNGVVIHAGARKADILALLEHAGRYQTRDMRAIG